MENFLDRLRNPGGLTLLVSLFLLVIPLLWPVTMYVWLRYLTGHRASVPPTAPSLAAPVGWPATTVQALVSQPTLEAAGLRFQPTVDTGIRPAAPSIQPAPSAIDPAPATSRRRWLMFAAVGVVLSVATSVLLAVNGLMHGNTAVVGGIVVGSLLVGFASRAKSVRTWALREHAD